MFVLGQVPIRQDAFDDIIVFCILIHDAHDVIDADIAMKDLSLFASEFVAFIRYVSLTSRSGQNLHLPIIASLNAMMRSRVLLNFVMGLPTSAMTKRMWLRSRRHRLRSLWQPARYTLPPLPRRLRWHLFGAQY